MSTPDWPPSPWGTDDRDRVERSLYPDGTLKSEIQYRGGLEHGSWREFHPNGAIAAEYVFQLGVYDTAAPIRTWYDNGQLESESYPNGGGREFKLGKSNKIACRYLLFGVPVSEQKYARKCARNPRVQRFPELEGLIAEELVLRRAELANPAPPPSVAPQAEPTLADGDFITNMLTDRCEEAFAWLMNAEQDWSRNLGELDWFDSVDLVRELYTKGAARVIAAKIENIPGDAEQTTNLLLIQLPPLAKDRKRLFAFENRHAASGGFDPEPDRGQQFLFLNLS